MKRYLLVLLIFTGCGSSATSGQAQSDGPAVTNQAAVQTAVPATISFYGSQILDPAGSFSASTKPTGNEGQIQIGSYQLPMPVIAPDVFLSNQNGTASIEIIGGETCTAENNTCAEIYGQIVLPENIQPSDVSVIDLNITGDGDQGSTVSITTVYGETISITIQ